MKLDRKIIDDIERRYSYIQNEARRRYNDGLKKLYEENPELKIMSTKLSRLYAKKARNSLNKIHDDINEEIGNLRKRIDQYIQVNNIVFPDKYSCIKCKDTGILNNGEKCSCYTKIYREIVYKESEYVELLNSQNFDKLDYSLYDDNRNADFSPNGVTPRNIVERVHEFTKKLVYDISRGKDVKYFNTMLLGGVGVGKTYISIAIANLFIDKQIFVKFIGAVELAKLITRYDKEIEQNQLKEVPVLIIDDLGTENITKNYLGSLLDLITARIIKKLPTIINSNLLIDEIIKNYSERFSSKLRENTRMFYIDSKDLRNK